MKRFSILLLLILIPVFVMAQQWTVGPRAGLNVARLTDFSEKWGCWGHAGVFGEWQKSDWALEADLLYSAQGAQYDDWRNTDHYLLIPLKAKYYIPACRGLNLFAGPQLDICLKRNSINFDWAPDVIPPGESNYKRSCMVSATFGVGYRFRCGLDVAANYNISLMSNLKKDFDPSRNSVFQFSIGWCLFKIGK